MTLQNRLKYFKNQIILPTFLPVIYISIVAIDELCFLCKFIYAIYYYNINNCLVARDQWANIYLEQYHLIEMVIIRNSTKSNIRAFY